MKRFVCRPGVAEVKTTKGVIRGYEYDGLTIFKGVPYAEARRFHRPEPLKPWDGVRECTSYGYTCPIAVPRRPQGEISVPHRYWVENEDCLNLNLWTPALDGGKRPVLVWLHGGGFSDGSSIEQVAYDGANLARRGDVVVVTINHRLNILGYLDLSEFGDEYENSGNAGTDDIIAALRWVHDNIDAFGGDPGNVTVFGQSGGGAKVTTLLQSPEADGLFHRGINMSGVIGPILADANGSGREVAEAMMAELGISTVREMETVPYAQLRAAYDRVSPALMEQGRYVGNAPYPNRFYAGDPLLNGFRAESANVPLLVGSVFGEFLGFCKMDGFEPVMTDEAAKAALISLVGSEIEPFIPLFRKAYPQRPLQDMARLDTAFRAPEIPYMRMRSAMNNCTYSYLFDMTFDVNERTVAWHCSDIPYVFANCDLVEYTHQAGMEKLEQQIVDTVLAFARTGNPGNASVPAWAPSTPDTENIMVFGNDTHLAPNFDHELIEKLDPIMTPIIMKILKASMDEIQH